MRWVWDHLLEIFPKTIDLNVDLAIEILQQSSQSSATNLGPQSDNLSFILQKSIKKQTSKEWIMKIQKRKKVWKGLDI